MIVEILASLLIILCTYSYLRVVRPTIQEMKRYKRQFEAKGYKVLELPFRLFRMQLQQNPQKHERQYQDPLYFERNISHKYDVVISSGFNRPFISISNPDLIKDFYATKPQIWPKITLLNQISKFIGQGLIFSEEKLWRKRRNVTSKVFHFGYIESLIPSIIESCTYIFGKLQKRHPDKQKPIWLLQEFRQITAGVILKGFFGCTDRENLKIEGKPMEIFNIELFQQYFARYFSPVCLIFGSKFVTLGLTQKDRSLNRRIKLYRQKAENIIKQRVQQMKIRGRPQNEDHKNMIEELYFSGKLSQEYNQSQGHYSYQQLIQQFNNFLIAGSDTSSIVITNAIIQLSKHPRVLEKVLVEIKANIKSNSDINSQNLKKMIYLTNVIYQALRMYLPAPTLALRNPKIQTQIGGVRFKQNTILQINMFIGTIDKNYFPNPSQFIPERWQDQSLSKKISYIFLPFSAGPRNCIGKHLSIIQSQVILIQFLTRYSFEIKVPISRQLVFTYVPHKFDTYVSVKN